MGVCFNQGQILGRGDLDIFLKNSAGNPTDAASITFALYCIDPVSGVEVLVGSPFWVPGHPSVGEYYAAIQVPPNAAAGDYVIRWTVQEFAGGTASVIAQEFGVVGQNVETGVGSGYSACESELIRKLRVMLRDNNPDRNYRFRPPQGEGVVGCYNKVNGYIWTDSELYDYLTIALDKWNSFPPATPEYCNLNQICQRHPEWKSVMLWGAVVNAALALAFNWTADEFGYSIGGVSLDLEKSSKYLQLKDNAEAQFLQLTEAKARTVKYIRGIVQPRFGRGIRSAFGPNVGRGVLSPRNFVVWAFAALNLDFIMQALHLWSVSSMV